MQDTSKQIKKSDMVLVGVNPQQVSTENNELKSILNHDAILLSFACGVEIKFFEEQLGAGQKVVRIVPNTLCRSGNRYSCVHANDNLTEEDKTFVEELVGSLGKILYLEEAKFNDFQAYVCTGPLCVYKFAKQ